MLSEIPVFVLFRLPSKVAVRPGASLGALLLCIFPHLSVSPETARACANDEWLIGLDYVLRCAIDSVSLFPFPTFVLTTIIAVNEKGFLSTFLRLWTRTRLREENRELVRVVGSTREGSSIDYCVFNSHYSRVSSRS